MSSLLDLPLELLYNISAAISPADIVNFACSCKHLLESSKASLARHQKLHSELRFVHDRDALTVPTVLRRAMDQPHTQWHIRKLEAWGSREGWSRWKNYPLHGGDDGALYFAGDEDAKDGFLAWVDRWRNHTYLDSSFFSMAELERYRQIMLGELRLSEEMTKEWMDLLESGYDEPLKVILIASCEGLRELSYITYDAAGGEAEKDPLSMLSTSIRSIYLLGSPQSCQWPVGFRALRSIIISEPSGYRDANHDFSYDSATVAPLFLLPAIRELRLTFIGYCEYESEDYLWEWDEAVSSVKDLEIILPDLEGKTLASLISACRALQSFSCDLLFHEPLICASLLKHAKHSLEEVRVDQYTSGLLSKNLDNFLARFDRLRHVSIVDTCLFNRDTLGKRVSWREHKAEPYGQIPAQWLDLRDLMPNTLETLRILFKWGYWPTDRRHRAAAFYAMLEDFVRSKCTETHVLENFRLLCITGLATTVTSTSGTLKSYCKPLKNRCTERDVDFHYDGDSVWNSCRQCPPPKQPLMPVPADECPWNGIGEAPDPTTV